MIDDSLRLLKASAKRAEESGNWAKAADIYDKIVVRSDHVWDRYFHAYAVLCAGRHAEAAALISRLPADLGRGTILSLKAALAERTGNDADAHLLWNAALESGGAPYSCLFGTSRALTKLRRIREARHAIERALSEPGAEPNGALFAYDLDLTSGAYDQAMARARQIKLTREQQVHHIISAARGMTSIDERVTLYKLACKAPGSGNFVDLGCWVGSLTIPMALGLEENSGALSKGVKIFSFDNFLWDDGYMAECWCDAFPGSKPSTGESFIDLFRHFTRPWAHLIEVVSGDILQARWNTSIDILSVDAMKSITLARHIMQEFFPHLNLGAFVFHQDYCCPLLGGRQPLWWIHIYSYLLADHFEVAEQLGELSGLLFRMIKPISMDDIESVLRHDLTDSAFAERAFSYCADIVPAHARQAISDSRSIYYRDRDGYLAQR